MSIGTPGGSTREGVCIAAGVVVVGEPVSGRRRTECAGEGVSRRCRCRLGEGTSGGIMEGLIGEVVEV
jgi:hypothetical protein